MRLQVTSDKLLFPEGRSAVVTLPHNSSRNIPVRVHAVASGTFPLDVRVLSPDEQTVVQTVRLEVRSTVVSSVGLALTVAAGLFLLLWWARHFRDTRRARKLVAADQVEAAIALVTGEVPVTAGVGGGEHRRPPAEARSPAPARRQLRCRRLTARKERGHGRCTHRDRQLLRPDAAGGRRARIEVVVPLSIRFGTDEYTDRRDLTVEDFYKKMAGPTAPRDRGAGARLRSRRRSAAAAEAGADGIVCINISSRAVRHDAVGPDRRRGLDGDSTCGSSTAARSPAGSARRSSRRGRGRRRRAIARRDRARWSTTSIARTQVFGALDTLDNLKKGGRIGGAKALLGSMLSIKPLIDISSGEVEEAGKARTRKKALAVAADRMLAEAGAVEQLAVCARRGPRHRRLPRPARRRLPADASASA